MAETRRDPRVEGAAARRAIVRAIVLAVLGAALWFRAREYWPEELTQPDPETRDRIALIGSLTLAAMAGWSLLGGIVRTGHWIRARRWDRMLDQPETAHLVPPLTSHLSLPRTGGGSGVRTAVLLVVVGIVLVVYGVLALFHRVPRLTDQSGEDLSPTMIWVGIGCLVLTVGAVRQVRRSQVAREVERLSNDAQLASVTTDVAASGRRATSIPVLNVEFTGDPGVGYRTTLPRAVAHPDEPLHILFLRLFDNVTGTQRFVNSSWRRFGYVHVLRSASQVHASELAAAKDSGSVAELFIATPAQLDAALLVQATGKWDEPRPHGFVAQLRWIFNKERGRYPVRALLCHGSFWQFAIDLLLERMDLVVIDLTGYRPANAGTRFEVQRVIDRYPIARVTLLADHASDQRFLRAQIHAMWAQMAEGSPNAGGGSRSVTVLVGSLHPDRRAFD
jgi:hypothetical protein